MVLEARLGDHAQGAYTVDHTAIDGHDAGQREERCLEELEWRNSGGCQVLASRPVPGSVFQPGERPLAPASNKTW